MTRFLGETGLERRTPELSVAEAAPTPRYFGDVAGREEPNKGMLMDYYHTMVRHRLMIGILAGCGILAGALLHVASQPVYRTRTSLDIHSLNTDFLNMRSADPNASSSQDSNIQTQIKLLESDALMERVRQRLIEEPHPESVLKNDLLSNLQQALHIGRPESISFQDLLDQTSKSVKVKPMGVTRLVEVSCDSWDPAFAANFCNTMTKEFGDQDLESRGLEAKHTSDWLMHQAADIKLKAEESQRRLVEATGGNGLILGPANTVGEDRLRQMQGELVKAQADRMEKEAQMTIARTATPEAVAGLTSDQTYSSLRTKLSELQSNLATMVPMLTEANPKVIHLRAEIKGVQDAMIKARTENTQRLNTEYAAAKHREDLLRMAYQTQQSSVSTDLQKGSAVDLLRREMESEQQLYQTLLQRAKEAGFASAMNASTIRVVDPARVPKIAVYPQRLQTCIVGLILGLLIALPISFFKDRNTAVFRLPGESEQFLHVDELGVIPAPPATRRLPSTARAVASGNGNGNGNGTGGELITLNGSQGAEHPALQTARWNESYSIVAEAYRSATLSLLLAEQTKQARIYIVTSPNAGEGKTTVTTNLGVALSKSKLRVLLIDGDLRKPSLHQTFGVSNATGLRNILRGEVPLAGPAITEYCRPTAFPRLYVLPGGAGREEVVELLHSNVTGDLLERLTREFDVILVDTPPMLHMADARILARQAHGAIVILRSGSTTREQALDARDLLDHDRVRIIGTILNAFNPSREGRSGYYKSYYAYQQASESETETAVGS